MIRRYAFMNLKSINATEVYISLQNNHIRDIDIDAFTGIEVALTLLNLEDNLLNHLPAALQRLGALTDLNVLGNSIVDLDGTVMQNIGYKLKSFSVSLKSIDTNILFPTEFRFLKNLQRLTLAEFPKTSFPTDIFSSFETSLIKLVIRSPRFEYDIPQTICLLGNLTVFDFVNTRAFLMRDDPSVAAFGTWNSTCHMSHLTHLNLDNNNLFKFPNISSHFPNLYSIHASLNKIQFIENEALDHVPSVAILDLSDNRFVRIPPAVRKLSNLTYLNMSGNDIVSIEDDDLKGLVKITSLLFSRNPLHYISSNAFHNFAIEYIDLSSTALFKVPIMLLSMPALRSVSMERTNIRCSCSELGYLRNLNMNNLTIVGWCWRGFSSERYLMDYIRTELPKCP